MGKGIWWYTLGKGLCSVVLNLCLNWHKRDVPSFILVSASFNRRNAKVHLFLPALQTTIHVHLRIRFCLSSVFDMSWKALTLSSPWRYMEGSAGPLPPGQGYRRFWAALCHLWWWTVYLAITIVFILVWNMGYFPRCHFPGSQEDIGPCYCLCIIEIFKECNMHDYILSVSFPSG